ANRPMSVATPLGPDVLLLVALDGEERLSSPFHFELEMLAPTTDDIPFDRILGKPVAVSLEVPGGRPRPIHGIVKSFCQEEQLPGPEGGPTFVRYRAEVVPRLWLLTKKSQSRIFQRMTVPEILKRVFADHGLDVSFRVQGTYLPREYCVQYRE